MPENRIKNKDLWRSLDKIKKQRAWVQACKKLGLRVTNGGKGSHLVARDPDYKDYDPKSLVLTIPKKLYKQCNQAMFKQLLNCGFSEEDLWEALEMF
ncbi:MAG: hypothetical protein K9M15_00645 [Candidatus Marinimicrobia bacterium]|nr:hypothetical protein [Candidatus Neomarinimicrobiota bacterium]